MKRIRGMISKTTNELVKKLVSCLVVAAGGLMLFLITGERHATITTSHFRKRYYQRWVGFLGETMVGGRVGVCSHGTNAIA